MFPGRKLDIVAVIRKSFFKIIILTFLNTLENDRKHGDIYKTTNFDKYGVFSIIIQKR